MVLRFIGVERAVEWAEKNFKKAVENINKTIRRKIEKKSFVRILFLWCPLYRERL